MPSRPIKFLFQLPVADAAYALERLFQLCLKPFRGAHTRQRFGQRKPGLSRQAEIERGDGEDLVA